ncbi:hypothetical protein Syun_022818 [Stephania yunnanensis]|uniref:Fatty acid desaturase domain-containing protein n=1 Tax=Stephania yunnanensis TaxID=152371 RepID=A0AAP0FAD9_9MAGN
MVALVDQEMKLIRGGYRNEKIWFSDVEVRSRRNAYWGRKWNIRDGIHVSLVMIMHLICLFAPFHYNLNAVWVAALLYVITGLFGITLSYHRNLAHLSFKLPKLLEYLFAYCGAHALQGHPIDWVSRHRFHHKYTDTERDPHSPREGFWFSHINWIFDNDHAYQKVGKRKNVADLRKQAFYRFLQSSYLIHPIALGALLFRFGGLPFLVWGMDVINRESLEIKAIYFFVRALTSRVPSCLRQRRCPSRSVNAALSPLASSTPLSLSPPSTLLSPLAPSTLAVLADAGALAFCETDRLRQVIEKEMLKVELPKNILSYSQCS